MSILRNNWHWMLFSLTVFGSISVLIFTQLNTDAEPETVYNPPSEEIIQGIREKSDAQKAQNTAKQPPPGASPNGHWHDGVWHDEAHTKMPNDVRQKGKQPFPSGESFSNSIPLPFGVTYTELGLEIPPKGYHYVWEKERVPKLDENGDPILLKEGEPYIEVLYETGFAPTPEQLRQYMKLKGKYLEARGWGHIAEAKRLETEMEEFKAKAQGTVPGAVMMSNVKDSGYSEKRREKRKEAYRKLGLDYLYDYIATGQISH